MSSTQENTALSLVASGALGGAAEAGAGLSIPVPFANRIVLLEDAHIAGTTHIRNIDELATGLESGYELELVRDTTNTQDAWAIRVLADGAKVGFIPADRNEVLARLMDGGKKLGATVTGKERLGNWHKIHMEVYLDD